MKHYLVVRLDGSIFFIANNPVANRILFLRVVHQVLTEVKRYLTSLHVASNANQLAKIRNLCFVHANITFIVGCHRTIKEHHLAVGQIVRQADSPPVIVAEI